MIAHDCENQMHDMLILCVNASTWFLWKYLINSFTLEIFVHEQKSSAEAIICFSKSMKLWYFIGNNQLRNRYQSHTRSELEWQLCAVWNFRQYSIILCILERPLNVSYGDRLIKHRLELMAVFYVHILEPFRANKSVFGKYVARWTRTKYYMCILPTCVWNSVYLPTIHWIVVA